jgi:hypothetical protein
VEREAIGKQGEWGVEEAERQGMVRAKETEGAGKAGREGKSQARESGVGNRELGSVLQN